MLFELLDSIGDLVADVIGDAPEVVAALLLGELWMACGTKEKIGFGAVKERTSVLDIGDTLAGHASVAVHGEVSLADDLLTF